MRRGTVRYGSARLGGFVFCPYCGKDISAGQAFCQHCGSRLAEEDGSAQAIAERKKTPWENRENVGFFNSLLKTAKDTLFSPSDFFKHMSTTGGLTDPLLYALIIGITGLMFHYCWDMLVYDSLHDFMSAEMTVSSGRAVLQGFHTPVASALIPFFFIFWIFVVTGALHLFLLLVHGAGAGYEGTFRVVAYSVSPFLLLALPFCGLTLMPLWSIILVIVGLREAHGISGGKAAFAVLFPFFFCFGLIIAAFMLFMGAVAALFGGMMHLLP